MEEKTVSLSMLGATNGFFDNVFLSGKWFVYDIVKGWVRIESVKPSKVPGKVVIVRGDSLLEQEVDATYMFGFRLI